MAENKSSTQLSISEISKTITTVSGSVAGLAFVFYSLGFIIVNSFLLTYGIREFVILKPIYLSAGVTFFLANSVALFLPIGLALLVIKTINPKSVYSIMAITLVTPLFTSLFSWVLASLILDFINSVDFHSTQMTILFREWNKYKLYLLGLFLVSTLMTPIAVSLAGQRGTFKDAIKDINANRFLSAESTRAISKFAMLIVLAFVILLTAWSQEVYPKISPAFGGGKPVVVQLVILDSKNESLFTNIGIKVNSNVTEQVKLIDESESTITIVTENGNAVKVTKSLIANIVFIIDSTNKVSP